MNPGVKPVAARYGMLTVLRYDSPQGWRVRCDCGNEKYLNGNNLRSETYHSCGCARYTKRRAPVRRRDTSSLVTKNAHLKPLRHATRGTPCWVCRNRTGARAAVALCYVCRGDA